MRLPRVEDIEKRIPQPEHFTSRSRGTGVTARVGTALGIAFGICFLTGLWSHFQYTSPSWLPIGPSPTQLYRVTQGLHVISGFAAIPLLLVKLWAVYPRFFERPPRKIGVPLLVHALERASIGVLVAAGIFQLGVGALNIAQWYPWSFSFRATHYAVAWIAIGALLVHIAVKLPIIREALGVSVDTDIEPAVVPAEDGGPADVTAPVDAEHDLHDDHDDHDDDEHHGPSRRAVLAGAGAASGLAVLLTAGQTVPFLRKVSVFAVRDGDGQQNLPVNRTAKAARADLTAKDPGFVLEIAMGDKTVSLSREQLAALPQRTHSLPIACVEGWSRNAEWTGVSVRDLIEMVGAPPDSAVGVSSLQTRGAFGRSELPADFVQDHRTLLALMLNGEPLSLDHGFPCRIIAPNRPGVLQTKWVKRLEVKA